MKKISLLSFLILLTIPYLFAQNLVPNPSFEKVHKKTLNWSLNKQVFESLMKEWTSPNQGSPDILFDFTVDKMTPKRRGVDLSEHQPRTGRTMIGIKTYGCSGNSPHCREYIQVKLKKSTEPGEQYYIEFWVNPMKSSLRNNNIGLALARVEISDEEDSGLYYFEPWINETELIDGAPNEWHKISATVTVDGTYDYLLIGNFFGDDATESKTEEGQIEYGYYLLDDVQVRPLSEDGNFDLNEEDLEIGNTISLKNVLFKTAKADLLPQSYPNLDKLFEVLKKNETLSIQLNGHTDDQGSEEDNLSLSEDRAKAVAQYLIDKGISEQRLTSQGFGESNPIASNEEEKGRKLNRRVEFVILKI
jgi:outer membrane protein OmpA-like peptidoglycan-associated protein